MDKDSLDSLLCNITGCLLSFLPGFFLGGQGEVGKTHPRRPPLAWPKPKILIYDKNKFF
jgi:hypothetical protein